MANFRAQTGLFWTNLLASGAEECETEQTSEQDLRAACTCRDLALQQFRGQKKYAQNVLLNDHSRALPSTIVGTATAVQAHTLDW